MDKKFFYVISHTHWDREWYMPFEQFRIRLVELMDRLFSILKKEPGFVFHLDAQTIVLEDYLEIRPEKEEELKEYIRKGNILVGPWYLQNDFYLTSGEATVRNLLFGTEIAEEFGKCSKAGYAPDQFGNISQLPQILSQFGIDNFIFGRGYGEYTKDGEGKTIREKAPTEFIWEGPDGTKLLAIHMKYWYNNAQRIYSDTKKAYELLETIEELFKEYAVTPYLLLMNGVDHLEAQDDLLEVVRDLKGVLPENKNIQQSDLKSYVENVKRYVAENSIELRTHKGELRQGHDWELLKGTLSSRVYLKRENNLAQINLENRFEPISSMYELFGAKGSYDNGHIRYLWKELLKNHPHDSICGCSRDEVHRHMEDNYERIEESRSYLQNKKMLDIAEHMQINTHSSEDNMLCLVNTILNERAAVIPARVMFLESENVDAFKLLDNEDKEVEFAVTNIEHIKHDVFSALNLPGVLDVKVFDILVYVESIKGSSVKGLLIKKQDSFPPNTIMPGAVLEEKDKEIENGSIKVKVNDDGSIDIFDLKKDLCLKNALVIEDLADRGDAYVFIPAGDDPIYSTSFPCKTKRKETGDIKKVLSVEYKMEIPACFDFDLRTRSQEKIEISVKLDLILEKGADTLIVETSFENKAKDHRMRLIWDTGIVSDKSFSDIPFDIVVRDISPQYPETLSDVHPNTSFAGIRDAKAGVAVFTEGNHEYEHLSDRPSCLAFTLVRSNGFIMMGQDYRSGAGAQWDVPENQCLREIKARFGSQVFDSDIHDLSLRTLAFRVPVDVTFASCDPKKFAGGRFAIQGSDNPEFYYLPDPYPEMEIPDDTPLIDIKGEGIVMSALKKSHSGEKGFVLRLVNMSTDEQNMVIKFRGSIRVSDMSEDMLPDEKAHEGNFEYTMRPKEILTLLLSN